MRIKISLLFSLLAVLFVLIFGYYFFVFSSAQQYNSDLAVGILNQNLIKNTFLNNGGFCASQYSSWQGVGGLNYNGDGHAISVDLWLGIPDGPWAPKQWNEQLKDSVSLGPTVTGTFFGNAFIPDGTDWGPIPESRGKKFSGDLLLSDLFVVNTGGILPLLSNSQYELSWPENIYGDRVWPGTFSKDPITGITIQNKFRADQEILLQFTDKSYASKYYPLNYQSIDSVTNAKRGYEIGAKAAGSVIVFDDTYNDDFFIVDLEIMNQSRWDYNDVFLGVRTAIYLIREGLNWMNFEKTHFIDYLIEKNGHLYNLAYHHSKIEPNPPGGQFVYFGIKLLETPPADRNEGEQLGLTGWHWLNEAGWYKFIPIGGGGGISKLIDSPYRRGEIIQYKLMSGDTTGLTMQEQERFFYPKEGNVNPNYDGEIKERIVRPATLMSSGPFNWDSGDTVKFAFAVVFGEDLEDLKANCRVAQKMYDHNYRRMEAPEAPTVSAVAGDKQVTLYWNDAAENSADFLTGYHDFEGYRIYRTSVDPALNQWGEQIKDGNGELVGFVPMAQFDLKNGISGLDPQYPHLELGFDTGIQHSWTDTTVKNGVSYWYAVCAYDQGISPDSLRNPDGWPRFKSLENSKGSDAGLWRNLVNVSPGAVPSNYQQPVLNLLPLPGTTGNGPLSAQVIDPPAVTGHTYTVIFDDTSQSWLTYSVKDETSGKMVLQQVSQVHGEEGPIFDGIRLKVQAFDHAGLFADSSGWFDRHTGDSSDCNYTLEAEPLLPDPVLSNYEFRFTEQGDTSYILSKPAPFEVWNTSRGEQLDWEIFTNSETDSTDSLKSEWSSGDYIRIREQVAGAYKFTWDVRMTRNPEIRYVERDTTLDGYPATVIDTLIIDNPPQTDDVARIITAKPFHSGDRFSLQTVPVQAQTAEKDELSLIKVVPNPYLVTAAWERHRDDHRLSFTHLPAQCEILIFNVAGEIVAVIQHDDVYSGTAFWDLQSYEGMEVASGLYLYVVKTPQGKSKEGKFAVVR